MKKNKIILLISLFVLIILLICLCLYFSHQDIETDEIKAYEVTEDDYSVFLNIIDDIDTPKFKSTLIDHEKLTSIKKEISLKYVINIIKDYDKSFKEEDYIISYNGASINGNILLTYFINNVIETSKTYNIISENNKVSYIMISGIKKENIDNIKKIDTKELLDLVEVFKGKDKEKSIYNTRKSLFKTDNILNDDNTINLSNMIGNITKVEEKYSYDYDSQKLLYQALLYENNEEVANDVIEVEIN